MNSDLLKLIAPIIFVLMWLDFARKVRSANLAGAALFFASIVAFSQNFTFVYREFHQGIQAFLVLIVLASIVRTKKLHKFNYIFFLFLCFIGISLVFSGIDEDAKAQLINILVAMGVTNYIYNSVSSAPRLNLLIYFISRLAIVSAIVGIVEFGLFLSPRIEATFANSNYYAFFLGIGYCFSFQTATGWRRGLSLAVILAAILLSGSRSAMVFPMLHLLWYLYRSRNFKYIFVYGVLGVTVVSGLMASGITRFSDAEAQEGSDAERLIFAKVAYEMASDHPLTGVGWGRYITEFANYSTAAEQITTSTGVIDVSKQDRRVTHNDLIRVLAELGWIALAACLAALVIGFIKVIKGKNHELGHIFPVWLGTVLFSLTHNNLNGALFWFLFLLPFYFFRHTQLPRV